MTYYSVTLQNVDSHYYVWTYQAGTKSLIITYYWPTQIQEQYDRLVLFFDKMAQANPFINDETKAIVRSYDVLDVINNGWEGYHPANGKTMEEWQEWASELIGDLANQYEYFKELLVWNLSINDGSNTYTSALRIGGTLTAADNSWEITFMTDKSDESIGQDDRELVTMVVGVE